MGLRNSMFGFIKFIYLKEVRVLKIRKKKYLTALYKKSALRFISYFLIQYLNSTLRHIIRLKKQLLIIKKFNLKIKKRLNFLKVKINLKKFLLRKKYLIKLLKFSLKKTFFLPKTHKRKINKKTISPYKIKLHLYKDINNNIKYYYYLIKNTKYEVALILTKQKNLWSTKNNKKSTQMKTKMKKKTKIKKRKTNIT